MIKQTFNSDEIKKVLCEPSVFKDIKGDHDIQPQDFEPPLDQCAYFGGYDETGIYAVACYHPFRDGLKYHPNVLPSHRKKHGKDFVQYTATMIECPIYAEIPNGRKRLINLAKKLGFDSISNTSAQTLFVKR